MHRASLVDLQMKMPTLTEELDHASTLDPRDAPMDLFSAAALEIRSLSERAVRLEAALLQIQIEATASEDASVLLRQIYALARAALATPED